MHAFVSFVSLRFCVVSTSMPYHSSLWFLFLCLIYLSSSDLSDSRRPVKVKLRTNMTFKKQKSPLFTSGDFQWFASTFSFFLSCLLFFTVSVSHTLLALTASSWRVNVFADLSGTMIAECGAVYFLTPDCTLVFVLTFVLEHVFPWNKPLLPLIFPSSPLFFFFSCSASLSLDDRGELVLIPWDEQRHREMDWCEAEACR